MRVRKQSSDGDMQFGGSQLDFWRDVPEAVGQRVQTRILLWLGEWFLDVDEGTPFMLGILGKHSQSEADSVIQNRILTTEGVTNIESYESELNPDTRTISIQATINTIFGPTDLEISNYTNF